MQRSTLSIIAIVALITSATASYMYTSGPPSETQHLCSQHDVLFQESTYSALLAGDYNGDMTLKDLRAQGDFGLGTFDALDGEMVLLNGTFYQIKSDGNVYLANDFVKSPFADVTSFKPDSQLLLVSNGSLNYSELQHYLDQQLPTKNIFYAAK
jgi:acetolactate decarboxylase